MNDKKYIELVKNIPFGKKLPDALYIHDSALDAIPPTLKEYVEQVLLKATLDTVA